MVRAIAVLLPGLLVAAASSARSQPFPEGNTLAERQKWAREHPEYKPFDLPLSAEDRAKYVACEEDWGPSCDAMRERYQEKAAAAIGGDQLPKADLAVQQKWARQNPDWKPFGVPMSETDRNNWVICVEQPQWEGCAKIRGAYEKKKADAAPAKPAPGAASGAPPAAKTQAAPGAPPGPEAPEAPAEAEAQPPSGEEAAARARAGGDKAMSRARGLGDALKRELREDGGGAPGAGGKADKAGPPTERDLLLASYSGYGASLAALGLVVGRDEAGRPALRRADGSPATAEDLAALRARIAAEPAALMRRPDFFSRLPRVRFEELKQAYRSRPELRDGTFRDIALSESGRDFERTASCEKLSGACAPEAKASYRKGDAVPPEELAAIHRRLRGGDPDSDFEDEGPGDEWESEAPAEAGALPAAEAAGTEAAAAGPARAVRHAIERLSGSGEAARDNTGGPGAAKAARLAWGEVPGAAVAALERGRGRMSAAGAILLAAAVLLLSRRST